MPVPAHVLLGIAAMNRMLCKTYRLDRSLEGTAPQCPSGLGELNPVQSRYQADLGKRSFWWLIGLQRTAEARALDSFCKSLIDDSLSFLPGRTDRA
jgi:hypothetical protein